MPMNDDPQLFNSLNKITRSHASLYLDEFAPKFSWKRKGSKIIDVGSADGSVTNILRTYLPKNYELLIGADISDKMVTFANKHYSDERTKFIKLDIESKLPEELIETFDHVFALYLFHWIVQQKIAFSNIYNLMSKGGECFLTFVAYSHIYNIFTSLSKSKRWKTYLLDVDSAISPYHNVQDPDRKVGEILEKIGFKNIEIKCKQTVYAYQGSQELKDVTEAINPFRFPQKEMYEEFLNDVEKEARKMNIYDEKDDTFKFIYNVIVVHCTK